jgi:hypothetical protein
MNNNLTETQIESEISKAEDELGHIDTRALCLWHKVKISPALWLQNQYQDIGPFWVIGLLGSHCLYFNFVEGGWGWGKFEKMGEIEEYHWDQLEIQQVMCQTVFSIDHDYQG